MLDPEACLVQWDRQGWIGTVITHQYNTRMKVCTQGSGDAGGTRVNLGGSGLTGRTP